MADVTPWGVKSTDDIFGLLALVVGGGTLADVAKITGASRTPIAKSESLGNDDYSDIVAKTVYGAPTTMFEATQELELFTGSLDLSILFLGQCATAGTWISAIDIKTSNGGCPTLSFTGRVGQTLEDAPTGKLNKWFLPAITVNGRKQAQNFGGGSAAGLGFTVDADTRCTGSGLNFTLNSSECVNGEGVPVSFSIFGANGSLSGDINGVAALDAYLPAVTLDTATGYLWKLLSGPSTTKAKNEYWTGSFSATLADPATSFARASA